MKKTLVALLLVGCFDPGPAPLLCSVEQPQCPSGSICLQGQCVANDGDAAVADLAITDMEQAADLLKPVSACAGGGGTPIGTLGAWACPGVFGGANPKASALCRSKVCSDSNLITVAECAAIDGFFVSSYFGSTSKPDTSIAECGNGAIYNLAFFGCGKLGFETVKACSGFRRSLETAVANEFTCSFPYALDKCTNTKPSNGVLCCP